MVYMGLSSRKILSTTLNAGAAPPEGPLRTINVHVKQRYGFVELKLSIRLPPAALDDGRWCERTHPPRSTVLGLLVGDCGVTAWSIA